MHTWRWGHCWPTGEVLKFNFILDRRKQILCLCKSQCLQLATYNIAACVIANRRLSMICFHTHTTIMHSWSCDTHHAAGSITRKQSPAFSMLLRQLRKMHALYSALGTLYLLISSSMTPRKLLAGHYHLQACLRMLLCCPRFTSTWASAWKLRAS